MTDANESAGVRLVESEMTLVDSREYDRSVVALATLDGPRGMLRIRRRYESLPRHNDVVETGGVDSNDELLDNSDEVHVHSKYYAVEDGSDEYFFDRHETWRPDHLVALADDSAFLDACRDHHLAGLAGEYAMATTERRRKTHPPE